MISKTNVPLKYLTSFQLAGEVNTVLSFKTEDSLSEFVKEQIPFHLIGLGSNSLINPNTSKSLVQIHPQFMATQCDKTLIVGAGMTVNQLMKLSVKEGVEGYAFMAGVPASVGGMIAMNFGCWGEEIATQVIRVFVMDFSGNVFDLSASEMKFGYRSSCIQDGALIVLGAELQAKRGQSDTIKQAIQKNILTRVDKQPLKDKTFGSIFKNPPQHSAGAVLESLGYKGKTIGPVTFSSQHANFLVNTGHATYAETVDILHQVQSDVKDQTGVTLELEVKLLS